MSFTFTQSSGLFGALLGFFPLKMKAAASEHLMEDQQERLNVEEGPSPCLNAHQIPHRHPVKFKIILVVTSFLVGVVFGVLVYLVYARYTED
jgi:hypothetical protein